MAPTGLNAKGGAALRDKVALVTGASRGLGRAIVLAFAAESASVVLVGRDVVRLREVAGEARRFGVVAVPLVADVSRTADVRRVVKRAMARLGRLDILVNNAGIAQGIAEREIRSILDVDDAVWDRMFAVNARGPFLVMREALPAMIRGGGGSIINVTSRLAARVVPGMIPYGPSKAAVDQLTRLVAQEFRDAGIRADLLHPGGAVATDIFNDRFRPGSNGPLPGPGLVGPPAVWLASDAARNVTGITVDCRTWTLPVDAGPTIS